MMFAILYFLHISNCLTKDESIRLCNIHLELLSYIIQICYRYSQVLNLEIPYPKAFLFQLQQHWHGDHNITLHASLPVSCNSLTKIIFHQLDSLIGAFQLHALIPFLLQRMSLPRWKYALFILTLSFLKCWMEVQICLKSVIRFFIHLSLTKPVLAIQLKGKLSKFFNCDLKLGFWKIMYAGPLERI